jgi:hypothetical protein
MRKFLFLLIAGLFAVSACSLAQTTPDEVAIRYSGSDLFAEAEVFKQCYTPGQSEHGSPGDKVYTYPAGQRTFKFSDDPGSDSPPISVTAQGGVVLTVSGVITFTPQFQDCERLQDFHERIGRKYGAYLRSEDDTSTQVIEGAEGWNTMLATYVKAPMERAIDNASLAYTWDKLTTDPTTKTAWEQAALTAIPQVMREQSGGEFFVVDSVILQAPQMPPDLQDGVRAAERARLAAAAAEIDKQAAANWPGGPQAYQEYQRQLAINRAITDGLVQVIPIPEGSGVNVTIPQPAPR